MKLPIFLYGSKILRENAADADLMKKDEITALVADMEETLAAADGCGLAAPQVGVPSRVLIVDGRGLEDVYPYLKDFKRVMINPELLEESRETCDYSEGCLSVPGIYAEVRRPERIKVRYVNEKFEDGAARDGSFGRQDVRGQGRSDQEKDDFQKTGQHIARKGVRPLQDQAGRVTFTGCRSLLTGMPL